MLLTFLLALTLGSERPLAELRTGSPAQQIRNVSGVAPAGNSGWLVAWSNGNVIPVAPVGANGLPTNIRKLIPGSEAALASTARGPLLVWSVGNSVFAGPPPSEGSFARPRPPPPRPPPPTPPPRHPPARRRRGRRPRPHPRRRRERARHASRLCRH